MDYIKKHRYTTLLIVILLLTIVLRFANYNNRWGLAYDQAHDAIVARYALDTLQLPLLGPFSSAGPYQTGGEWYWIVMAGTILFPFSVITPWIFMTLLYVGFVYLIIRLGTELVDRRFGLIAGFLAAVSPAQITQGTNLTNQSPLALVGLFSVWCSIRYLRTKQRKYLFCLAMFVGLGASIHLQGAALGVLLIVTFIAAMQFDIKTILCIPAGLLIPWIPVFIVDLQNNFFNTKNMVQYYLYDQYKISLDVLGRRWKTYAGVFVPHVWSFVIGGHIAMGYATLAGLVCVVFHDAFRRNMKKEWVVLFISIAGMLTILRYTRTPLFESYVVFMHALILLATAWLIYWLLKQKVIPGLFVLIILGVFSLQLDIQEISGSTNLTAKQVTVWKNYLTTKYPGKAFSVYDNAYATKDRSLPLVLFLQQYNKQYDHVMRIGLIATDAAYIRHPILYGHNEGIKIIDLTKASELQLEKEKWARMDPDLVYQSTELWYKDK